MSQISPPIRILLVLTIAVLGVYMLFLRPKPVEVPPAEPANTSVSQPGKIRDAVEEAVGETETAAATATTQEGSTQPGTAAASDTSAKDLKGLPKPVRKAIRKDKVLVLLFWNERSADDRAVHAALDKVDRWDGRVYVKAAPLKQISKYGRIARGVDVEQSPTVVVADRNLRAATLVGYTDRATIDQAVLDALRNTSGIYTSAYLRKVDAVCVRYSNKIAGIPYFYGNGEVSTFDRRLSRVETTFARFGADFKAIKAPKKWSAFRTATIADFAAFNGHVATYAGAVTTKSSLPSVLAAEGSFRSAARPVTKRVNKRFDAEGLFRCGSQF